LTTERIKELLAESDFSKTSKRNLVRRFHAIENFAKKAGFLSDERRSILEGITIRKERKAPLVFTPAELMRLLIVLDRRELAYVATMAFGASRRSEYEQMTKAHLDFEDDQARIDETIAKNNSRRTLDKTDTLKLWLALADADIPKEGSLIGKNKVAAISGDKARLKQVGLVWKNNALRHSFCSYHLAKYRDATETSLLAGNSPAIIFSNYNAVVSKKAAIEWFNITPDAVRAYADAKSLTHLIKW
jgi:integrase